MEIQTYYAIIACMLIVWGQAASRGGSLHSPGRTASKILTPSNYRAEQYWLRPPFCTPGDCGADPASVQRHQEETFQALGIRQGAAHVSPAATTVPAEPDAV